MTAESRWSVGQCATMACLMELSAPKPGNVHRGADFDDATFAHFALSAAALAPAHDGAAAGDPLGRAVLAAVDAAFRTAGSNTYLGAILLMTPMAKASRRKPWKTGIDLVLAELTPADAENVYAAIRLAQPGGLGRVESADVNEPPPASLVEAMRLAADRDLVARQYANGFEEVALAADWLRASSGRGWREAIVETHLRLMAEFPDSLIARKCGPEIAEESARRAAEVRSSGEPGSGSYARAIEEFDGWLRADGRRRNPGTTADLVTAALFGLLRDSEIAWPLAW